MHWNIRHWDEKYCIIQDKIDWECEIKTNAV
jgi:hypothetical protein